MSNKQDLGIFTETEVCKCGWFKNIPKMIINKANIFDVVEIGNCCPDCGGRPTTKTGRFVFEEQPRTFLQKIFRTRPKSDCIGFVAKEVE